MTFGIRRMALLTFSSGTCEGVPCKRMKLADRTEGGEEQRVSGVAALNVYRNEAAHLPSGSADEKIMQVMIRDMMGSE